MLLKCSPIIKVSRLVLDDTEAKAKAVTHTVFSIGDGYFVSMEPGNLMYIISACQRKESFPSEETFFATMDKFMSKSYAFFVFKINDDNKGIKFFFNNIAASKSNKGRDLEYHLKLYESLTIGSITPFLYYPSLEVSVRSEGLKSGRPSYSVVQRKENEGFEFKIDSLNLWSFFNKKACSVNQGQEENKLSIIDSISQLHYSGLFKDVLQKINLRKVFSKTENVKLPCTNIDFLKLQYSNEGLLFANCYDQRTRSDTYTSRLSEEIEKSKSTSSSVER